MSSLPQIRDALKTTLQGISGLQVYDTVPGQIVTPAAVVRRRSGPREDTLGGATVEYTMLVTFFSGKVSDPDAQDQIDAFISPHDSGSVFSVLNASPTLGGVVSWAKVTDVEQEHLVEYANVTYLGVDVVIDVGD